MLSLPKTHRLKIQDFRVFLRYTTLMGICLLIVLDIAWEWKLAPLRPGGSWLILKVLLLTAMLPGILKARVYVFQWTSMAILLYLAEGAVRATSDINPLSRRLAWLEIILSLVIFIAVLLYISSFKMAKTVKAQ